MAALIIDNLSIVLCIRWCMHICEILVASMLETALVTLVGRFLFTAGVSATCRDFLLIIVAGLANF